MNHIDNELDNALQFFSRFFDLIRLPIAVIDQDGKYIYYNQESAEIDGYSAQKALGKHLLELYPNMPANQSTMLNALHKGTIYCDAYQMYNNAKGKAIDYRHSTVPLYNSKHKIVGAIEIGRDVSNLRKLQEQVITLNQKLYKQEDENSPTIIFRSQKMYNVVEQAKQLARNQVPVLIVGETGTGKELFARLVHNNSIRATKPFIALNCSALPTTLIESTLFGTVKGAFTGAENRNGYLTMADGGTLFLDEVNAMPLEMQAKLLRFLQEKTFWKIGGNQELRSDVRIIAATNINPNELIDSGQMRNDLFYRLNVGILKIPPLRERLEDIPILANHFIQKYHNSIAKNIDGLSDRALAELKKSSWPGNVRMLENVIVRSMAMQNEDGLLQHIVMDEELLQETTNIKTKALPVVIQSQPSLPSQCYDLTKQVEEFEKSLIISALNTFEGNVACAAKNLNLSRTTLQYKIKKYQLHLGVI